MFIKNALGLSFLLLSLASFAADMDLFTGGTKLRGANMFQQEKYSAAGQVWNPNITDQDLKNLRANRANLVNFSIPGIYDVKTYAIRNDFLNKMNSLIALAKKNDLYIILSFRTGPGRGEGDITGDGFGNRELFSNVTAQNAFIQMWKDVATLYKNDSHIVAYDILVEPHNVTASNWKNLAQKIVDGIRSIDPVIPIIVSPHEWGGYDALATWTPLTGTNLIYTIHQYEPFDFTHYGVASDEINELNNIYAAISLWKKTYNKPMIVNEYGVDNFVVNRDTFLNAQLAKLEELGANHASWIWEVEYDPDYTYDAFDFKDDTLLFPIYKQSWAKNTFYPAYSYACGAPSTMTSLLGQTRIFVYKSCTSRAVTLRMRGDSSITNFLHTGSLTVSEGTLTLNSNYSLETGDWTRQVNSSTIDYNFQVNYSSMDGLTVTPSSTTAKLCMTFTSPTTVTTFFGPSKIQKVFTAGQKINLATMELCP